jgi:hypothetical protein
MVGGLAFGQDDPERLRKLLEEIRAQKAKLEALEQQILAKLGEKSGAQGKVMGAPNASGQVVISSGKSAGVQPGDAINVTRDGKFIAMLQVIVVEMDKATCQIVAKALGEEVKAGDTIERNGSAKIVTVTNEEQLKKLKDQVFKDADTALVAEVETGDKRTLESAAPQMEYLVRLKEAKSTRYGCELDMQLHEVAAKQLAARYREVPAEQRKDLEAKIRRHLESVYDDRAKSRKIEIDEIESKLKQSKSTEVKEDKQKYVAQRLKELTKE